MPVVHRSATKQYMLVGAVVAAGIGVLVFLRMQGVGAGLVSAGEDAVEIQYPLDAPTNANTEKAQRDVLAQLASSGEIAQVPAEQIEQNPFRLQSITSSKKRSPRPMSRRSRCRAARRPRRSGSPSSIGWPRRSSWAP